MNRMVVPNQKVMAKADMRLNHDMAKKLWKSFSLFGSELELEEGLPLTFILGECEVPVLETGKEYAISVTDRGAAVIGRDYGGLMRGFLVLLMKMEFEDDVCYIKPTEEQSAYLLKNRMIHICVFPDNTLYEIKKIIRLAGLCQYTHIVIEFWGTLQYDCMNELAWQDHSFTKEEARELIREARCLGMEPIPMFNQLGHATGSRVCHGKHVVLEQNPRLQSYFTPDGWAWNIHSPKVLELMKQVRSELYELFGEGTYMHIGCDEAYYYSHSDHERKQLPGFLTKLTNEVVQEGRRPMMWMDMLLEKGKYPSHTENGRRTRYVATCAPDEVELLQKSLNPATVMVDWQYRVYEAPVPTLLSLKNTGYDAMGAPWYEEKNYGAYVDTIADHDMYGIMMTTWHTLKEKMPSILGCAQKCGIRSFTWSNGRTREETATMLRRISFEGNTYETSGWTRKDIVDHFMK